MEQKQIDKQRLAFLFLHEDDENHLTKNINQHLSYMDAEFFEILREESNKLFSEKDKFIKIVKIHLKLSGNNYSRYFDLTEKLVKSFKNGKIYDCLRQYEEEINSNFLSAIIGSAESNISQVGFLHMGALLLKIAEIISQCFNITEHNAWLYLTQSSYYLSLNKNDEAWKKIEQCKACQSKEILLNQACTVNEGLLYFRSGRYMDSIKFHESKKETICDHTLRIKFLSNLAITYNEIAYFSKALSILLKLSEELQLPEDAIPLSQTYGNLSNIYSRLGSYEEQEKYLRLSIETAKKQAIYNFDWTTLLVSYANYTMFYLRHQDTDSAEKWFLKFKETAEKTDVESNMLTYARLKVELEFKKGNYPKSLGVIKKTKELFQINEGYEYLSFLGIAGYVQYRLKEYKKAAENFIILKKLSEKTGHNEFINTTYGYLGLCYILQGRKHEALKYFEMMFNHEKVLRNHINKHNYQCYFSSRNVNLYHDIINVTEKNDHEQLFNYLQKVKAQAINFQLKTEIHFHDIHKVLPERVLLAEYYISTISNFCLIISKKYDKPIYVPLSITESFLGKCLNEYIKILPIAKDIINKNPFDFLLNVSTGLIDPIKKYLKEHDILVVAPSSYAHYLPFNIFPYDKHEFLIDKIAVSYIPNATVFYNCLKNAQNSSTKNLVLCNHREEESSKARELFIKEIEIISSVVNSSTRINTDDSFEYLEKKSDYNILHIASHGHFNFSDPMKSGLVLKKNGKDQLFFLDELFNNPISASLLFLSGCDTGRIRVLPNDEIIGIVSIFLSKGINSLILSHWPILSEKELTLMIIEMFYKLWQVEKKDKAIALQEAMLKNKRTKNPYDWAGYFLVGSIV
jgi:tetratricopeptide (TPR) repeat protein